MWEIYRIFHVVLAKLHNYIRHWLWIEIEPIPLALEASIRLARQLAILDIFRTHLHIH